MANISASSILASSCNVKKEPLLELGIEHFDVIRKFLQDYKTIFHNVNKDITSSNLQEFQQGQSCVSPATNVPASLSIGYLIHLLEVSMDANKFASYLDVRLDKVCMILDKYVYRPDVNSGFAIPLMVEVWGHDIFLRQNIPHLAHKLEGILHTHTTVNQSILNHI